MEVYPDKFMKTQGEISDKLTYPDELLNLNELSFFPDKLQKSNLVRLKFVLRTILIAPPRRNRRARRAGLPRHGHLHQGGVGKHAAQSQEPSLPRRLAEIRWERAHGGARNAGFRPAREPPA